VPLAVDALSLSLSPGIWRASIEADLKEMRDIISRVKLLITFSVGGGRLSVIAWIITISKLNNP
jgi:hypothetical protein